MGLYLNTRKDILLAISNVAMILLSCQGFSLTAGIDTFPAKSNGYTSIHYSLFPVILLAGIVGLRKSLSVHDTLTVCCFSLFQVLAFIGAAGCFIYSLVTWLGKDNYSDSYRYGMLDYTKEGDIIAEIARSSFLDSDYKRFMERSLKSFYISLVVPGMMRPMLLQLLFIDAVLTVLLLTSNIIGCCQITFCSGVTVIEENYPPSHQTVDRSHQQETANNQPAVMYVREQP